MSIVLHIDLDDAEAGRAAIEQWYAESYVPALRRQDGFEGAELLSAYPTAVRVRIGASGPVAALKISIRFASEDLRARWEASEDHQEVWGALERLARYRKHEGWDVVRLTGRG